MSQVKSSGVESIVSWLDSQSWTRVLLLFLYQTLFVCDRFVSSLCRELDSAMERRLEEMERRLKEHVDRRLDALEQKLEKALLSVLNQGTMGTMSSSASEALSSTGPSEQTQAPTPAVH